MDPTGNKTSSIRFRRQNSFLNYASLPSDLIFKLKATQKIAWITILWCNKN